MISFHDDPTLVPLPGRVQLLVGRRRDHVVKAAGLAGGAMRVGVRMLYVVEQLLLAADTLGGDRQVVFYSAISGFLDLPLPRQLEVGIFVVSDDVAPARAALEEERAVLHRPALLWKARLADGVPSGGGLPVKKQLPTGGLFLRGESIRSGVAEGCERKQRRGARRGRSRIIGVM